MAFMAFLRPKIPDLSLTISVALFGRRKKEVSFPETQLMEKKGGKKRDKEVKERKRYG